MSDKHTLEPSDAEVKRRLKEFGRKHREKYPVPPKDGDEPDGILAGEPDKLKDRFDEEFDDDYGNQNKNRQALFQNKNRQALFRDSLQIKWLISEGVFLKA